MVQANRNFNLEKLAGDTDFNAFKVALGDKNHTVEELNDYLINAIAYSRLEISEYLLSLGADIVWGECEGAYWAICNNELKGIEFVLSKGVDVNVYEGKFLNTSIEMGVNENDLTIFQILIRNGAKINFLTNDSLSLIKHYGNIEMKKVFDKNITVFQKIRMWFL